MMEKIQRFGSAMLAPVLIFAFAGLAVGIAIICKNEQLLGSIAAEGTGWYNFWSVWESGAWTVFNQMELLFVLGLCPLHWQRPLRHALCLKPVWST